MFLHGFMESVNIWKRFRKKLIKKYRVITIDLPGHGKSEVIAPVHTMELLAEVVHKVLKERKVSSCTMTGHSMGGYVTLAFAGLYPKMVKSIIVFHSHPFSDNEVQKENRERSVDIAEQDKSGYISHFIPDLFPENVRETFADDISKMVSQASVMTKEAVIASIRGMKERADQSEFLRNTDLPVLFIIGLKDSKFPQERLLEMITLPKKSQCLILKETGHMGYIEEEKTTLRAIKGFISC